MTTGRYTSMQFLSKFFGKKLCFGFYSASFSKNELIKSIRYLKRYLNCKDEAIIELTELLISAPEFPIMGIKNCKPVYMEENKYDAKRIEIIKDIEIGIIQFVKDYLINFKNLSVELDMETLFELLISFAKHLSEYDKTMLKKVFHSGNIRNDKFVSLYDELKKII